MTRSAAEVAARRSRLRLYVASFAMDTAAFCFFVFVAVHAKHGLDAGPGVSGLLGTIATAALTATSFLSGAILARRSHLRLHLVGAAAILALAVPVAFLADSVALLATAGALFGGGLGLFWPSLETDLATASPPRALWRTLGTFNLWWAAGICVGSLAGSGLYAALGSTPSLASAAACAGLAFLLIAPRTAVASDTDTAAPAPPHPAPSAGPAPAAAGACAPVPACAPDTDTDSDSDTDTDSDAAPVSAPDALRFLRVAWVANFAAMFSFHGIVYLLPHVCGDLDISLGVLAWMLFSLNVARWVFFGVLRWWAGWHYSRGWLVLLQSAAAVALIVVAWSRSAWPFFAALPLLGLFAGLSYYSSLYYGLAVPHQTGRNSGLHEGILSLGMTVGPLVCGQIVRAQSDWPGVVFVAAGAMLVVALIVEIGMAWRGRDGASPPTS